MHQKIQNAAALEIHLGKRTLQYLSDQMNFLANHIWVNALLQIFSEEQRKSDVNSEILIEQNLVEPGNVQNGVISSLFLYHKGSRHSTSFYL